MPQTTITFNLNDTGDYEELLVRLKRMVMELEGIDELKEYKRLESEEPISEAELCERLKRKPATIAVYRCQGMPYISGKPCTYIFKECYDWIKNTRGINKKR